MPRYGKDTQKTVEREMREFKRGELRSGSGRKVTSRKQAIAIGLSEARRKGDKVPPPPGERREGRSSSRSRSASSRSASSRRSSSRSSSSGRSSRRRSS